MFFNSFDYFIFFPSVYFFYWLLAKYRNIQNFLLLISSYIFYSWWSVKFLLLLVLSTLLDFLYGFGVGSSNKRKSNFYLYLSIINNIGILFIFKYYNFFSRQFVSFFEKINIHLNVSTIELILPIGISFYTFHGMSYVFDIYRQKRKPVTNFIDYSLFVSFFPLLVAGPIERANHLLPQIESLRSFNYKQSVFGIRLIIWGLFKKILADRIAFIINPIFGEYQNHTAMTLLVAAIGFSFQIYCDFSGYSDIAIGSAKLLGFELLSNFKFPYFSRNIAEFWRRWHISLSSWFKDYLYIPLGGSKNGILIAIRNTFIIFIISGLWHGANWNYIVWGLIHAFLFLPLLLFNKNRKYVNQIVGEKTNYPSIKEFFQISINFLLVTLAWVFFRIIDVKNACKYVYRILSGLLFNPLDNFKINLDTKVVLYIIIIIFFDWQFRKNERELVLFKYRIANYFLYVSAIFFIINEVFKQYFIQENQTFIYFQF